MIGDSMSEKSTTRSREATPTARKPYQKPSFRHERIFETMALACGKIHPNNPNCKINRKSS